MKKSESNGRIRQVAVLLSSVDAATARNLLGQLPAAQARLVRQQLATLQNVTPAERESALKMLAQLKQRVGSFAASSTRSEAVPAPEASPAEALLSHVSSSIDRIEIANANSAEMPTTRLPSGTEYSASQRPTETNSQFVPIQAQSEYPFHHPTWTPAWQQWSGEELARLLMNERATLIAAVLLQAPAELGSVILESLPVPTATSVLAALPQLHTTEPSVLQDIYNQLHQRLTDFERQSSSENAGLAKLHAILSSVSTEARHTFQQNLAISEPLLAHSLGVTVVRGVTPSEDSLAQLGGTSIKGAKRELLHEVEEDERSVYPQLADTAHAIDPPIVEKSIFDSFEGLASLRSEDLAIVLRSVDPNTVLLAVSGASRALQIRIEGLVDPGEIKRLRQRLKGLRSISIREKRLSQDKIVNAANTLLRQGRISSDSNVRLLAAA